MQEGEFDEVLARDAGVLERFAARFDWRKDGRCQLSATVPQEFINAAGFAHGGLFFGIADTAAAYAVGSLGQPGVTVDASIQLMKGAVAGDELTVLAEVIHRSRRLATVRAEVRRADELLATASFSFLLRPD